MRVWRPTTGCPPRGAARNRLPPPCPPSTCPSTPPTTPSSSHPTRSPYSPPTPSPRPTTSSPHPIPRSSPPPRTPRCRITPPRRSRLLPRITRLRGRRPLRPPNRRGNRAAVAAVGPLRQLHNSSSSSNSSSWPCSISNSSRRPTRPRLSITTARRPWWPIWRRESRTLARCIGTIRPPSRCSRRAECFRRRPSAITRPPP